MTHLDGSFLACAAGTAYAALRKLEAVPGAPACAVVGLGPVGLAAALLTRAMGWQVVGSWVLPIHYYYDLVELMVATGTSFAPLDTGKFAIDDAPRAFSVAGSPGTLGKVSLIWPDRYWSYEEWPDEVKREYEYRPGDAEALLDEAGYPRGADGVRFKLAASNSPRQERTYIEIVGEFFRAIGVDFDISTHTEAEGAAAWSADTHEFDMYCCAIMGTRRPALWIAGTVTQDVAGNSLSKSRDPRLETFYNGATHAADLDEFFSNIREIDEIVIREHFGLVRPMVPLYQVAQPWVQGWNGEWGMGYAERHTHFSRLWIDSALKEEMTGN